MRSHKILPLVIMLAATASANAQDLTVPYPVSKLRRECLTAARKAIAAEDKKNGLHYHMLPLPERLAGTGVCYIMGHDPNYGEKHCAKNALDGDNVRPCSLDPETRAEQMCNPSWDALNFHYSIAPIPKGYDCDQ